VTADFATLELLARGMAVGVFVLLAIRIGARPRTPVRLTGALFALAAASHTLTQSPPAMAALGLAGAPVWMLSAMGAGLFWAFALELFNDNRRLAPARFLPALALFAIASAAWILPPDVARSLWLAHNLLSAGLMAHVLMVVIAGWRGDLVEARRRLRGPLLVAAAVYALLVVSVQIAELYAGPAAALSCLAAVGLLALSVASGVVFLRDDPALLAAAAAPPAARRVAPRDQVLMDRLTVALEREQAWREEGLTIGALARRLGAPEHHLRKLINESLGYRNFSAFLNERRIEAAKTALADPQQARTTVAVIAFEVGFSSLGPFNRAFREATGEAPTQWRRKVAGETARPADAGVAAG
jgi:AraC-like DNA-binding protein